MRLSVGTNNGQNRPFKSRDLCIQVANHSLDGSNRLLNRRNLGDFFRRKGGHSAPSVRQLVLYVVPLVKRAEAHGREVR